MLYYSVGCWYLLANMGVLVSQPGDHSNGFQICLGCPKKILAAPGPCDTHSALVKDIAKFTF